METREQAIAKIKKLLVMSEKATQNERETAYFMAQKMMAKYHLELTDVVGEEAEKITAVRTHNINAKNANIASLGMVIATNFRCMYYFSGRANRQSFVFYGFESDATIAASIFEDAAKFAIREATRIADKAWYQTGTCAGVRDEWMNGFARGIRDGFAAQVQMSTETALMVVTPQEVKDEYAKIKFSSKGVSLNNNRNYDRHIQEAGYQNGLAFAQGRRQGAIDGGND